MKKSLYIGIGLLAGILLFVLVFLVFPIQDLGALLLGLNPYLLLLYIGVSLFIFTLQAWRWRIISRVHGIEAPFIRFMGYRFVGFGMSFVTPGPKVGGEPLRAAMLNRECNRPGPAMSSTLADKSIELTSMGIMFAVALAVMFVTIPLSPAQRTLMLVLSLVIISLVSYATWSMLKGKDPLYGLLTLFRLHKLKVVQKHKKHIDELEEHNLTFYKQHPKAFWKAYTLSAIAWVLSLAEYATLFLLLGFTPSFLEIMVTYAAVGLAYIIPIPMALGSLEALQTTVFSILGLPAALGIAIALLTRGRDILWSIIGFMFFAYYGVHAEEKDAK